MRASCVRLATAAEGATHLDLDAIAQKEGLDGVRRKLTDVIVWQLARVLHAREDEISRTRPLGEIGLDSLMLLEFAMNFEETFGIHVSLTSSVGALTVASLANEVISQLDLKAPAEDCGGPRLRRPAYDDGEDERGRGARRDRQFRPGRRRRAWRRGALSQKSSRLSQEARRHLLRRVETMQHSTRACARRSARSKDRVSFATLPGYDELRLLRSIGQKFGVDNPYFRVHEARAGSQTRIAGKSILNFSSYDYLGLNEHPRSRCRPPRRRSTATASRPRRAATWPANARSTARWSARSPIITGWRTASCW